MFPFIKSEVLSAIDSRQKDAIILYVDGDNNPGFSCGPIVHKHSKIYYTRGNTGILIWHNKNKLLTTMR